MSKLENSHKESACYDTKGRKAEAWPRAIPSMREIKTPNGLYKPRLTTILEDHSVFLGARTSVYASCVRPWDDQLTTIVEGRLTHMDHTNSCPCANELSSLSSSQYLIHVIEDSNLTKPIALILPTPNPPVRSSTFGGLSGSPLASSNFSRLGHEMYFQEK